MNNMHTFKETWIFGMLIGRFSLLVFLSHISVQFQRITQFLNLEYMHKLVQYLRSFERALWTADSRSRRIIVVDNTEHGACYLVGSITHNTITADTVLQFNVTITKQQGTCYSQYLCPNELSVCLPC